MHWMKNECTSDNCTASIRLLKETYAKQITAGPDPRDALNLPKTESGAPWSCYSNSIKLDKRNFIGSFIPLWWGFLLVLFGLLF